ncbi:hypothetical protein STVIR_5262 [Streptomyces viridochromogenes Tue57]|uniref:Uncharacterized protein n=1 Tax=Streptomyces viridochromogenes Tue57 TaxID=1160705 RepID=L8PBP1_STRVR|nr:hypothetical protein STVIR_5262 [Streptomyces viridochromogenes Tue57]
MLRVVWAAVTTMAWMGGGGGCWWAERVTVPPAVGRGMPAAACAGWVGVRVCAWRRLVRGGWGCASVPGGGLCGVGGGARLCLRRLCEPGGGASMPAAACAAEWGCALRSTRSSGVGAAPGGVRPRTGGWGGPGGAVP